MSKVIYDFTGENFAVTGASSGIGWQVALELAEAGSKILAIGRNVERLEALRCNYPEKIFTASLDVCDAEALEAAISNFVDLHGKLKGGVHAAGITGITPLRYYDKNTAQKIMNVSFWAGIDFLQIITRAKYSGVVTSTVLFSSIYSISPAKGMLAYSSAKSAVNSAVRCAAKELCSKHHRVNSILPGWTDTPMTENLNLDNDIKHAHLLGVGKPEYISKMVLFLLSDASCWITGANIPIDGGYLA